MGCIFSYLNIGYTPCRFSDSCIFCIFNQVIQAVQTNFLIIKTTLGLFPTDNFDGYRFPGGKSEWSYLKRSNFMIIRPLEQHVIKKCTDVYLLGQLIPLITYELYSGGLQNCGECSVQWGISQVL